MLQLLLPGFATVEPLDEMDIRADYEALLNSCVRLTAYAQSSSQHVFWPIVERQNRLAEDDLVTFALRARRFITATSLIPLAYNVLVPIGSLRTGQFQHMWRIITTLIHYTDLTIFRSVEEFRVMARALKRRLTLEDMVWHPSSEAIGPIIFVTSDQHVLAFDASALLRIFSEKILRPAVASCRGRGVELTDVQRHVALAQECLRFRSARSPERKRHLRVGSRKPRLGVWQGIRPFDRQWSRRDLRPGSPDLHAVRR